MNEVFLNIQAAKTHLSKHLGALTAEGRIVLCRRNRPVAEIRLLPEEPRRERRLGLARGEFTIPDSFFDPLPDELLGAFEGKE